MKESKEEVLVGVLWERKVGNRMCCVERTLFFFQVKWRSKTRRFGNIVMLPCCDSLVYLLDLQSCSHEVI